ncbi:hypothetical protein GN244_ATG01902 [Phytophthora infestans]|uniref:HAT C-terminal dimerisation domain-containing protein n=1 Tax=Phytophthora infestans TaxID=4787 RepID=A0A833TM53_PHYIN|nr:hypothetical protein GN244_ATG01902 [Phytophthora infestans]
MSTHLSISYLDTRIRVYYNDNIMNFYLMAIPMHESHTGEAIQVLEVLCPHWRDVMLGITTDGERKMTGVNKGLSTRFQKVCRSGFMRVWCGLHQLDLALQNAFKAAMNDRFFGYMMQTIAYLRRQGTLIRQMDTTAPLLQDTRWESMQRCCTWFKKHRVPLTAHLNAKTPVCKPPLQWWLILMITFRSLEGYTTLVTEQLAQMKRLSSDIQIMFGVRAVTDEDHSDAATLLASDFARVIATLVERVNSIEPELNEKNEPLPPALSRKFVKLKDRDLSALIVKHRDRMAPHWTDEEMDAVEQEHLALCDQYRSHEQFRRSIDKEAAFHEIVCTVEDAWNKVDGKFAALKRFAGGLATTFPGTSTVESDFSILKWEKPPSKSRLTNFSLEGVLHAKQFDLLNSIDVSSDGKPGFNTLTSTTMILLSHNCTTPNQCQILFL